MAAICAADIAMARAEVPTPKVTPISGSAPGSADHNYPFFSMDIVLKNFGYIEKEFFFEGTANTYANAEPRKNASISGSGFPYRSRLLVRQSGEPIAFQWRRDRRVVQRKALAARGKMPKETESLLVDQATVLMGLVKEQAM